MKKTLALALGVFSLVATVEAQPLHVRVDSKTVDSGSPYVLAVTVADADSLAGILLDFDYGPSMNRVTAPPSTPGDPSAVRTRTNPAAYPDSSGTLHTGWVSFPSVSGNDSILVLSFEALGEPGARDTVRVTVIDAVNQRGEAVATTVEPGIVTFSGTGTGVVVPAITTAFGLSQNVPNPFSSVTEIGISIPAREDVVLEIYDVLGKRVKTLIRERKEAGTYRVPFDASRLPSGIYWCVLRAGRAQQARKLVLIR